MKPRSTNIKSKLYNFTLQILEIKENIRHKKTQNIPSIILCFLKNINPNYFKNQDIEVV